MFAQIEPDKAADAINSILVNAGVIGTLALIMLVGGGWIFYSIGMKMVGVADRFVNGTLEFQDKLVERFDSQSAIHASSSAETAKSMTRLADRLDDVCVYRTSRR